MTWLRLNKVWFLMPGVLLLVVGGLYFVGKTNVLRADPFDPPAAKTEKYLFVWAGDQARKSPDFLAVVNFDEKSADYGKVITTVPLTGPGATWPAALICRGPAPGSPGDAGAGVACGVTPSGPPGFDSG